MWAVVNHTPYVAEGNWVQDKDANKIWLVALKATFELLTGGGTRLAWEQRPVLRVSEPRGEEGKSSLRYESDLMGGKSGTDVHYMTTADTGVKMTNPLSFSGEASCATLPPA